MSVHACNCAVAIQDYLGQDHFFQYVSQVIIILENGEYLRAISIELDNLPL